MMKHSTVAGSLFGDSLFPGFQRQLWPLRQAAVTAAQGRASLLDRLLEGLCDGFPYDFTRGTGPPGHETPRPSDGLELVLDTREFSMEEISVKLAGRQLVVAAIKQMAGVETVPSGGSTERRGFVQRIDLPEHVDLSTLACSLAPDGLLKVEAASFKQGPSETRTVPIRFRTSLDFPITNVKTEDKTSEKRDQRR